MSLNFLTLDGYGFFIWTAYIFTFLCCFGLYWKTKKALKKQEKIFLNKYNQFAVTKTVQIEQKKVAKEILPVGRSI